MQVFLFQSALILVHSVVQTTFQIIKARHEEKVFVKNFPEYADYKKKVVVREEPIPQGIKERLIADSG